jgi:hypothetical protein
MFWPIFYSAVTFWGIALAGGLYWARRYVRAIEARHSDRELIATLEARVLSLEHAHKELQTLPNPEDTPR